MSLIPFRADLHCHSTFSDGSYTPEDLVKKALSLDLEGLALTDHDTFDGLQDLENAASGTPLSVISGAEFSTTFAGFSVHLLAYAFNPKSDALKELVEQQETRREERVLALISRLNEEGIPLTLETILEIRGARGAHAIGRPHIAEALLRKGFVKTREEAFRNLIGEKGRCFVPAPSPKIEEVIGKIHEAKGVAILAHPHLLPRRKEIPDLLKLPLDGIEARYGRMRPDQNSEWISVGKKNGWIMTGGSDFHGDHRPDINLGSSWTNEETFHDLLLLYRSHRNS